MERIVFADTAFWIALTYKRDQLHLPAQAWRRYIAAAGAKVVTTEPVLWEWLNALSATGTRIAAAQGYERCHADPRIEVVCLTPVLRVAALDMYRSRPDKAWSLTDCLSFTLMHERSIAVALAADRHFQQAGFRALLLEEPPAF